MKNFFKRFSFGFVILLFCMTFCACSPSKDNKDPKSKEYPNIPNEILSEVSEVVTPEMYGNIATFNISNNDNYFSFIKIGNSESAIKVNATISNNTFKNQSETNIKILDCYEFTKSSYTYLDNQEFGNFDKNLIEQVCR